MKYIIPKLNGQDEITNPTIEIIGLDTRSPRLHANPDFVNNIIGLDIYLIMPNCRYFLPLKDIHVESMVLTDGALLMNQVLTALNEQFGV